MKYDYITAGITIVNDIRYADGKEEKDILGGCCVYAYTGIAAFTDKVLPVTTGGPDFRRIYGTYMEENDVPSEGFYETMPSTHHTVLTYKEDGSWTEDSVKGWDYFTVQKQNCMTRASQLLPFIGPDTKGIYLDALADDGIFDEIELIRNAAPSALIMWEPPTQSSTDPDFREAVMERILKADIYSMNLNEASHFFGKTDRDEIIREIHRLGKPCFLREGEDGASWCKDSKTYHLPAFDLSTGIDPTGCGNCSTAAALYAVCEGYEGAQVTAIANGAAQLCAAQLGPMPVRKLRNEKKASKIAEMLLERK